MTDHSFYNNFNTRNSVQMQEDGGGDFRRIPRQRCLRLSDKICTQPLSWYVAFLLICTIRLSFSFASVYACALKLFVVCVLPLQVLEISGSFRWSTSQWKSPSPASYASSPCVITPGRARKHGSGYGLPKLCLNHDQGPCSYHVSKCFFTLSRGVLDNYPTY